MEQEVPVEKEAPKREDTLKTKISELDLSARVINSLEAAGIKTVSGLLRKTETDLLQVEGMGEKAVGEVVKILQKLGLTLKEEKK